MPVRTHPRFRAILCLLFPSVVSSSFVSVPPLALSCPHCTSLSSYPLLPLPSSLSSSRSTLTFPDLVGLYAVQSGVMFPPASDVPKLRGSVPWSAMAPLTALQSINLDSNEVSGAPFTADVAKLTSLQIM